ncbi:ferredoxin reductase-like C-terminal NADP-linked domain-containing protein [Phellopilus nigrolimitatus]|nr:ferredoxin reductase-like C-terminal NADP-linked domain-containing protein [Phellopilus nigrolimitatus]
MSSFLLRHSLRCPRRQPHQVAFRLFSSKDDQPSRTSSSPIKWYALVGLSTSALYLWFLNASASRKMSLRPLSHDYFIPATLISTEKTNENTKLLRLSLSHEVASKTIKPQSIWSVYVKDSDIQVERPYTPLEGISASGEMVFWIKKYPHGEVGRWLHSKLPGEKIELRGPEQTWIWENGTWDNIVMIAGGTGIAPFYQLLHSQFAQNSKVGSSTKFTLLHSYRSPSELPPDCILKSLSSWAEENPRQLEIRTFVDNLDGSIHKNGLAMGRISKSDITSVLKAMHGKTVVLVCGPEPMLNALAGPKGRDHSQGHVGGILGQLNDNSFAVWKL